MSVLNETQFYFAQGYGCEAYGETVAYNSCEPTGGGSLVDTGTGLVIIATVAVTIMFIAAVVKIWKRPAKSAKSAKSKKTD